MKEESLSHKNACYICYLGDKLKDLQRGMHLFFTIKIFSHRDSAFS